MARSYKKVAGYRDRNPWAKRQANKKVRRTEDVPNGKAYKKLYQSYDIADWKWNVFYPSQLEGIKKPWQFTAK